MRYSHLPGLGGRRPPHPDSPNAGWTNPSFPGYADHMETREFRADFGRLVELSEGGGRVCLMCSEAVWWRCHRRMISDALLVRGFTVEHVLGEHRRTLYALTLWEGRRRDTPALPAARRLSHASRSVRRSPGRLDGLAYPFAPRETLREAV